MIPLSLSFSRLVLSAIWLSARLAKAQSPAPGSFADGGNTKVSAMMMFVGNDEKVYILDKAENNAEQINGHPAWGSRWDINTHQVETMDIKTNVFCAVGMHLPNGSYVTLGGNGAVGKEGALGSDHDNPYFANFDQDIGDFDGRKSIRILNPCSSSDDFSSPNCQWYDDPSTLAMQATRWYASTEPLADGTLVIMGGFSTGGYINRNYPDKDPVTEGGAAQNNFELWPSDGQQPKQVDFLVKTSGLNSYVHMYLLRSGKMFIQANTSTTIWDHTTNSGQDLPDMPGGVVRVYPGSGAAAMLPLTPKNGYNPTILFCGGAPNLSDEQWGNYANPFAATWTMPSSKDCQRITPEPLDNSAAKYEQDDDLLDPRTMGQFITLPTGKMLIVNGGAKGTAGYTPGGSVFLNIDNTNEVPNPFQQSLATDPVLKPALYDPDAPAGSRWSNDGLSEAKFPRLYHSSAILLPDGSVMVAGSNPNVDVNTTNTYQTTYEAEIFYPPYFSASTRPQPSGIPKTLSYGGSPFDVTVPASSYSGSSNDAADSVIVSVIRPGWTTHGMNFGQRFLQLNNTYTVNSDGSLTLHVSQMPPMPEVFQPGPAWVYVTINGIPSNGSYVIVGNGQIGTQPKADASALPGSVRLDDAKGSADGSSTGSGSGSGSGSSGSGGGSGSKSGAGVVNARPQHIVVALLVFGFTALFL